MVQRIEWIDFCRGLFMLMILWFHTEAYYAGNSIIPYYIYVEDALAGFFFLSGYFSIPATTNIDIRGKATKLFRHLIVPYLFFTIVFALPKALVHDNDICISDIFINIATGKASWFVYCLIMCNVYIILIHNIAKTNFFIKTCLYILPLVAVKAFNTDSSSTIEATAISLVLMYAGHIYRKHEKVIHNMHTTLWILLITMFVAIKCYEINNSIYLTYYVTIIDSYPLFFVDTLLFCLISSRVYGWIAILTERVFGWKKNISARYVKWIGSHCIVYYFICGATPLAVSKIMPDFQERYYMMVPAYILVCIASTAIVFVFYKSKFCRKIIGL